MPNNANIAFEGLEADALIAGLPEVALSTGSACSSEAIGPSHVLSAIGLGKLANSSLRFGVSRYTTEEEVDWVVGRLGEIVIRLRRLK